MYPEHSTFKHSQGCFFFLVFLHSNNFEFNLEEGEIFEELLLAYQYRPRDQNLLWRLLQPEQWGTLALGFGSSTPSKSEFREIKYV